MDDASTTAAAAQRREIVATARALRERSRALAARYLEARARFLLHAERHQADAPPLWRDAMPHDALPLAAELHESITAYASTLRRSGATCEHAVSFAREIADDAIAAATERVQLNPQEGRAVAEDLVLWTIDAYLAA